MVEISGHIRLVSSNSEKRTAELEKPAQSKDAQGAKSSEASGKSADTLYQSHDVVSLVSRENRRAANTEDRPTMEEADQALRELQYDLSETDQDLGEIHSNLDRRLILSLLAPLVTS